MRADVAKSSLSGVAQFVISTLLVLITIPVFVRLLGAEAYGVFSLVALVGTVNIFANLGLNSSLIRFLAQQGKSRESDYDIVVNLLILLTVLSPLTMCGIVFRTFILVHVLSVPSHLLNDSTWLFISMLVGNVFLLVGQTFTAILDSQQKIYLTNLYQVINSIIYWGLILLVLSLGYSLGGVAVAILASTLIWFCIVVASGLQSWGRISFEGLSSNGMRVAKKQLHYGLQIYTGGLVSFLYEPITKILVSRFLGVTEVGLFDIGLRARNQIMSLATKLLYPLYPIISKLDDPKKIRTLVHDIEQKILLLVMPLIGIVLLAAKPLVLLFFHSNVDAIAITIACIVSAFLFGSFTVTPHYQFLMAKGHASKTIILQVVNVLVNAIVFLVCHPWLGYYAVVAANAVAILTSCGLSLYYQNRYLDSLIFDSAQQMVAVGVSFSVALALGYFFSTLFDVNVWKLISGPMIVMCAIVILYRYFGLLNAADISRYIGERTIFSKLFVRVLCKSQS